MHKYPVRHTENNWAEPYSIEPCVVVNFWGYAYSKTPLDFGKEGYLLVSRCKDIKLIEGRTQSQKL